METEPSTSATVSRPLAPKTTALVLASALHIDRHCFRRLVPLDPLVVELREWSRMAEKLKEERNRARQPHPPTAVAVLSAALEITTASTSSRRS